MENVNEYKVVTPLAGITVDTQMGEICLAAYLFYYAVSTVRKVKSEAVVMVLKDTLTGDIWVDIYDGEDTAVTKEFSTIKEAKTFARNYCNKHSYNGKMQRYTPHTTGKVLPAVQYTQVLDQCTQSTDTVTPSFDYRGKTHSGLATETVAGWVDAK